MRGNKESRGFGPFSGRQLTIIICVAIVMLMLPVGAFAISGSNVFVTDHASGKQAKVNGAGQVLAAPNAPKDTRIGAPTAPTGPCTPIMTVSGNTQALVVTSLNVSWSGMTPGTSFLDIWDGPSCDGPIAYIQVPTASGNTSIPLGAGMKVPSLYATGFGPNPGGWVINAPAYLVPKTS